MNREPLIRRYEHNYFRGWVVSTKRRGTANGSLDLYLDGVHISSYKNMQFIDGDALWGDMNMDPVWGGLGGTVPATQTFDVDHFYMSGKQ